MQKKACKILHDMKGIAYINMKNAADAEIFISTM